MNTYMQLDKIRKVLKLKAVNCRDKQPCLFLSENQERPGDKAELKRIDNQTSLCTHNVSMTITVGVDSLKMWIDG